MWVLLISFVIDLLLMSQKTNAEIIGCNIIDTVDLSSAQKLSNESYLYEGLLMDGGRERDSQMEGRTKKSAFPL